jgi:hypothetical protein
MMQPQMTHDSSEDAAATEQTAVFANQLQRRTARADKLAQTKLQTNVLLQRHADSTPG